MERENRSRRMVSTTSQKDQAEEAEEATTGRAADQTVVEVTPVGEMMRKTVASGRASREVTKD